MGSNPMYHIGHPYRTQICFLFFLFTDTVFAQALNFSCLNFCQQPLNSSLNLQSYPLKSLLHPTARVIFHCIDPIPVTSLMKCCSGPHYRQGELFFFCLPLSSFKSRCLSTLYHNLLHAVNSRSIYWLPITYQALLKALKTAVNERKKFSAFVELAGWGTNT